METKTILIVGGVAAGAYLLFKSGIPNLLVGGAKYSGYLGGVRREVDNIAGIAESGRKAFDTVKGLWQSVSGVFDSVNETPKNAGTSSGGSWGNLWNTGISFMQEDRNAA